MYEQLLIHCFGDFISQNEWIALNKRSDFYVSFLHAIIYTIPFLIITQSGLALVVICLTHAVIDRYEVVKYINRAKNCIYNTDIGLEKTRPGYFSYWLLFWQDFALHIISNYFILKYL